MSPLTHLPLCPIWYHFERNGVPGGALTVSEISRQQSVVLYSVVDSLEIIWRCDLQGACAEHETGVLYSRQRFMHCSALLVILVKLNRE